jgi:hypothetical protein
MMMMVDNMAEDLEALLLEEWGAVATIDQMQTPRHATQQALAHTV